MKPFTEESFMDFCDIFAGHECYKGCKLLEACLMWNNTGKNSRGRYQTAKVIRDKVEFINSYIRKQKLEKLLEHD